MCQILGKYTFYKNTYHPCVWMLMNEFVYVYEFQQGWPSTYSMTMQRCLFVSKEQNIETTKGFSAKVRMSRSTNTCWIWFLSIRFCRLIFFMAKRWRVSLWRTRKTALHGRRREERGQKRRKENYRTNGDRGFTRDWAEWEKKAGRKMWKYIHHLRVNISSDLKWNCPDKF